MSSQASRKHFYPSTASLQEAVALSCAECIRDAVSSNGVANISLSGGSTPKRIYEILSTLDLPWDNVHWFWGDERNVTPDDSQSNERMVRETLFKINPPPASNIHPVPVDMKSPEKGAAKYEAIMRKHFGDTEFPRWDLVLLGMGDDAHTASLFPETVALQETEKWFVPNWVEKLNTFRYTLTAPAINSAREAWFLVAGEAKRQALHQVWQAELNPTLYPSQLIQPTAWHVTNEARPDIGTT